MSLLLRRYHAKAEPSGVEAPGGNASKQAWTEYALAEGKSAEELNGLTRDQIRDLFSTPKNQGEDKGQDENKDPGQGDGAADDGADKVPAENADDADKADAGEGSDKTE